MSKIKIRLKNTEPPEGYKFTEKYGTPCIGGYVYNCDTRRAIRMCAGMPVLEGFLLEPTNPLPEVYRGKKVIEVTFYPYRHYTMVGFMFKGTRWRLDQAISIEGFFSFLYKNDKAGKLELTFKPIMQCDTGVEYPAAILFNQ